MTVGPSAPTENYPRTVFIETDGAITVLELRHRRLSKYFGCGPERYRERVRVNGAVRDSYWAGNIWTSVIMEKPGEDFQTASLAVVIDRLCASITEERDSSCRSCRRYVKLKISCCLLALIRGILFRGESFAHSQDPPLYMSRNLRPSHSRLM